MLQKVTPRPGPNARKSFQLNEILSLMSGLPLACEGPVAIYRLVAFVMETDANAAAAAANLETVKQCLREQLPFLEEVDMTGLYQIYNYESAREEVENPYLDVWMEMQTLRYGNDHRLMPFNAWKKAKQSAQARASEEAVGAA
jgi:hypothetical protein